ncbi:hypothetical protein ACFQNE_12250 [Gordonia phosphorivorans]|uniref:Uncharacterized protein n=1 Tax=Gordonia phosphorivorans TaxID=1056982 RepID=A0ABV6HBC0_9ACTN
MIATAILLVVSLAPATAETPAERCKRETAAYNNAWKNTWAQANPGKSPSDAPKPPVPYKCGGGNEDPPTLSPSTPEDKPDKTVEPTKAAPDSDDSGEAPSMNAPTQRRELEHPDQGQPTVQQGNPQPQNLLDRAKMLVEDIVRAANPRAKYLSYTKADQKLADNYVTPTRGNPLIQIKNIGRKNAEEYCTRKGMTLERKALAGNTLYTWWQEVEICGMPGVTMTSIKILHRGGETKTPTWSYTGMAFDPIARVGYDRYHGYTLSAEKFDQKIVWNGLGAGERTECFGGTATIAGDFDANDSCQIGG